jgi:hypothetical protein
LLAAVARTDATSTTRANLILNYARMHKLAEANKAIEALIKEDDLRPTAKATLAMAFCLMGDLESSFHYLRMALEDDSDQRRRIAKVTAISPDLQTLREDKNFGPVVTALFHEVLQPRRRQ